MHHLIRPGLRDMFMACFFCILYVGALCAQPADWFRTEDQPEFLGLLPAEEDSTELHWRMGPDIELVHDELLDMEVLEHSGGRRGWIRSREPLPQSYRLRAFIRVMERGHGAVLSVGVSGSDTRPERGCSLTARPTGDRAWRVDAGRGRGEHYLEDRSLLSDGPAGTYRDAIESIAGRVNFGERFTSAPSPLTADESYRREVEAALSAREPSTEQWVELRIERRGGEVRMWFDGVPVGESRRLSTLDGDAHLQLDRSVRVASLEISPLDVVQTAYEPVSLRERLNAVSISDEGDGVLSDGSLPDPGPLGKATGEVEGIPFVFCRDLKGRDHVDIGESLFRQRNRMRHGGTVTREIWPTPHSQFDPGRITFTVPNRAYSRLLVIAAFDESPYSVPVLTARFFIPRTGFPIDSMAEVPGLSATSAPGDAVRLPVSGGDGSDSSLWLVPIELDSVRIASELRERSNLSLELTGNVHSFRSYPDPHNYGWLQGGLPSGVRVFAMTLEKAPVYMIATGNRHGNVYVRPEKPLWQVDLVNQHPESVSGQVRLTVTDPYGEPSEVTETGFSLAADGSTRLEIPLAAELNGLYTVQTEVEVDGAAGAGTSAISRNATFAQLPYDTRQTSKEESPWGIFSWTGGHHTHDVLEDDIYLLRAAGARYGPNPRHMDAEMGEKWGILPQTQHIGNDQRAAQPWAFEDPYDPEKYEENRDQIGKRIAERSEQMPHVPSWSMFIETAITAHLTYGVPRQYIGEDPTWTEEEERRVRGHMHYGKAVCEGIRMYAPDAPIALGWAASAFTIPLLQSGFPRELFDYIGADDPVFERTPEMPIREVSPTRTWLLAQAMKEYGYDDVPVIHVESYYPSSNPLALGWRRSADHYPRLHLVSLSHIPDTTFVGVFSLQDCSSYWGSQHYGEHGMISRRPEANPKPAYVAYATMTRLLDPPHYEGYVPTGSLSAFCLHFTSRGQNVYPMWTLQGEREARIRLPEGAEALMVDESGNEFPLELDGGWTSVSLTPTVLWVTSAHEIKELDLGETDHSFVRTEHPLMAALFEGGADSRYRPENQVKPGEHSLLLDSLKTPWNYVSGPYEPHEKGHWGMPRHDGPMSSRTVSCEELGADVWEVELEEPDVERQLTAWYGVFEPDEPVEIPGKARALGVWADGRSNWGRIVYEIEDAEGELWRSIGTRDDWNCDDTHTWSYFNHDGWRYIEFPLPSHLPYDNYREKDTVWWGSDGGNGVVELPVTLRRIIIEHRTHNLYAHELVEMDDRSVRLHGLKAVYDDEESMTDAPIELQRETAGLLLEKWETEAPVLPNPIAELRQTGVGESTEFAELAPPDDYDGLVTRLEIKLTEIEGAQEYRVYVSAYEDGRGAELIATGEEPVLDASNLQPGIELFLFATYVDADGRESQPTEAHRILLKDDFPFR